ncbi:Secreted frizzled-related protein [Dirofilaria immitis]
MICIRKKNDIINIMIGGCKLLTEISKDLTIAGEKDIVEKHHQQIVIGQTFAEVGGTALIEEWCTNGLVLSGLMALNELLLLFLPIGTYAYISESWAMLTSDRPSSPKCVDIPRNLTLCYGIQYSTMRLPNLLEHETVDEVIEQAAPWIPLHRLNCHPDTQLFLCSLFAPVCLTTMDREIMPCQSLCTAVQQGCENRMRQYGFPWPEMLSCNKYPKDNDMCIDAVSEKARNLSDTCSSCSQVSTYENILDHYCRSQIVVKVRIGGINKSYVSVRKARSLKRSDRRRSVGRDTVIHFSANRGCPCHFSGSGDLRFLIMADQNDRGDFIANLILPWRNTDKPFKRAIRSFRKLNCQSLGREIRESAYRRSLHRKGH